MISLNKVTKYYDVSAGSKKYILKDVTLDIPNNTSVGILGLNGAGKSTLLRMIGGMDFPNKGKITSDISMSWPLGLSGGFQSSLTGEDNVKFVCRVNSVPRSEIKEKIEYIKDFAEIGDYFYMPVKTYSSGMKSRLAFALSMAFKFDVYLIDEILSVGDKNFKLKCNLEMENRREESHLLMVSHSMNSLRSMCDSGMVLQDSNLKYYPNISDAIAEYEKR